MELVSANDGLLSNSEVMLLLEQRAASRIQVTLAIK